MSEHSELPWHSDDTAIFGRDGVIARIPNHPENGKNWKIDAPYIVLAANQFPALSKALELIEYVSRKDSLTEQERLQSVRTVVTSALAALKEASR